MMRMIASIVLELAANAVGLIVASLVLAGFSIDVTGFVIVLAIFTIVKFVMAPLLFKMSMKYVQALSGGVALVTTLVGLLITTLITDGLTITGLSTWILSTLIVWLFGVIASIVLPMFLFKQVLANRDRRD